MNYKLIALVILALLAVIFILQNVAIVEIKFLFWAIQMSRSLLMFFLLLIGMVMGWFLHSFVKYRKTRSE